MDPKKIARINELAKKKREVGLTEEEMAEREQLKVWYAEEFRRGFHQQLLGIRVVDPEGKDITPEKLRQEQRNLEQDGKTDCN